MKNMKTLVVWAALISAHIGLIGKTPIFNIFGFYVRSTLQRRNTEDTQDVRRFFVH